MISAIVLLYSFCQRCRWNKSSLFYWQKKRDGWLPLLFQTVSVFYQMVVGSTFVMELFLRKKSSTCDNTYTTFAIRHVDNNNSGKIKILPGNLGRSKNRLCLCRSFFLPVGLLVERKQGKSIFLLFSLYCLIIWKKNSVLSILCEKL